MWRMYNRQVCDQGLDKDLGQSLSEFPVHSFYTQLLQPSQTLLQLFSTVVFYEPAFVQVQPIPYFSQMFILKPWFLVLFFPTHRKQSGPQFQFFAVMQLLHFVSLNANCFLMPWTAAAVNISFPESIQTGILNLHSFRNSICYLTLKSYGANHPSFCSSPVINSGGTGAEVTLSASTGNTTQPRVI